MAFNGFDNEIARLVILQRIELATPILIKFRKLFGRYLFTNFFSKLLLSNDQINFQYYSRMTQEYNLLKNHIDFKNTNILSIGGGMCGLELIINQLNHVNKFAVIEKNYISKKIIYGWDYKNLEAYNNLKILKNFANKNQGSNFEIYDFELNNFPEYKFDLIISLYSLDYHYDFNIYRKYLKKICTDKTQLIFDTVRPDYFNSLFNKVKIISDENKKIHSSKRIICSGFASYEFK